MRARAIFVRGLFAVSRIYSRFVRAITRFQRKFSANHAKSAYFQRKSRKVSVNNINDARLAVENHGGRAFCFLIQISVHQAQYDAKSCRETFQVYP